jgi:hypothetical protein
MQVFFSFFHCRYSSSADFVSSKKTCLAYKQLISILTAIYFLLLECVVVPGSKPLVAECGCISFNGETLSGTAGFLRKEGVNETISYCKKKSLETKNPSYCANNTNTAPLCKRVNSGTVYSNKYDYVSLYNPVDWQEATGEGGSEKICTAGGTVAICYTAACINAPPTSPYLTQKTNATCYCPVYNVKKGVPFAVTNNATTACGPKTLAGLKPSTIIYNGA